MSTRLRMLVIAVMTIGACVSVRPDERAVDAGAGSGSADAQITPVDTWMAAGPSRLSRDAGRSQSRRELAAADLDAETGADEDAGAAELSADIALDCRETLRCKPSVGSSVPQCIQAVTESLSKSPQGRARFVAIIDQCRTLRGCEYVSCVEQTAPPRP